MFFERTPIHTIYGKRIYSLTLGYNFSRRPVLVLSSTAYYHLTHWLYLVEKSSMSDHYERLVSPYLDHYINTITK